MFLLLKKYRIPSGIRYLCFLLLFRAHESALTCSSMLLRSMIRSQIHAENQMSADAAAWFSLAWISFYRDRFCEVTGLIDIKSLAYRYIISKHLERNDRQ